MDEVWISTKTEHQTMRRVIRYFGDYVYYSTGGNTTQACKKETFQKWILNSGAKRFTESDRK